MVRAVARSYGKELPARLVAFAVGWRGACLKMDSKKALEYVKKNLNPRERNSEDVVVAADGQTEIEIKVATVERLYWVALAMGEKETRETLLPELLHFAEVGNPLHELAFTPSWHALSHLAAFDS